MRIIIAGSRDFNDYDLLETKCHEIFCELVEEGYLTGKIKTDVQNMIIISGTAKGADTLGEQFAVNYEIQLRRFMPDWDKWGKSAGFRRNEDMAQYALADDDLGVLIAFWDGKSKGTKHMIDYAKKYNLRVFIINY